MQDSNIATNGGPGVVNQKRLQNYAQQWGKLPEKERAKAMAEQNAALVGTSAAAILATPAL